MNLGLRVPSHSQFTGNILVQEEAVSPSLFSYSAALSWSSSSPALIIGYLFGRMLNSSALIKESRWIP